MSMKATLYEALGIAPAASDEEVRAALRRLIRKYYAKTRDGQGNVEEALRFINHASRILSDPDLRGSATTRSSRSPTAHRAADRARRDQRRRRPASRTPEPEATRAPPRRTPLSLARPRSRRSTTLASPRSHRARRVVRPLPCGGGRAVRALRRVHRRRDRLRDAGRCDAGREAGAGVADAHAARADAHLRRRSRHGVGATPPGARPHPTLVPQTDLAILNWRREKSVFLGTNQPQEDASWIFQLRMAELERAKSGRTSEPRPWNRLAARALRLRDLGTGARAAAVRAARARASFRDGLAFWLGHPLVAPILITASWMPIEALLIAVAADDAGQVAVRRLPAVLDQRRVRARATCARSSSARCERAFRVWWEGIGCGFPLLAPILIAVAYEKLAQNGETDWDFAQDCLVTHGPPGVLNTVTGVVGLAAMLWLYGVAWHEPMAESIALAKSAVVAWVPSPPSLLPRGFQGDVGKIGSIEPQCRCAGAQPPSGTAPARQRRRHRGAVRRSPGAARAAARRGPAHAARAATGGAPPSCAGLVRSRILECRPVALPWLRAAGAGLSPGRDQRVSQGRAIRSERSQPRRGDRQEPARHRRSTS